MFYDKFMTLRPRRDLMGGVAGALASIPQTMAYGVIAVAALGPAWTGAGVVAGLIGSVVAGVLAVLLGSNPLVVAGPRAAQALVFGGLLGQLLALPEMTPGLAVAHACAAVVLAGAVQMLFGLLRLGRAADFIPAPVVAGFFNASALLILASQAGPLGGLGDGLSVAEVVRRIGDIHIGPLILGVATAALILAVRRWGRGLPAPLVGVVAGTAAFHLAGGDGGLFGHTIPPLPEAVVIGLTDWAGLGAAVAGLARPDGAVLALVLPAALSIAALSALDAVLSTVAMDHMTLRRSTPDRDLIAQGLGNAVSGALGLLPSSGSMARAVLLYRAGGRSAVAPLVTAGLTAMLTLTLAPSVALLPQAVVAGLLVVVGLDLFDAWTLSLLRRLPREGLRRQPLADLFAVAAVVAAALMFGLVAAVAVGIAVSLAFFVVRMARSPVRRCYPASVLAARMQGDAGRLAFLRRHAGRIMVVELEGALFFGSIAAVQRQIDGLLDEGIGHVILDFKRVKDIDATAARAMERLHRLLDGRGGCLVLAYVEPERRGGLRRAAFAGPERRRPGTVERRLWRVLERTGSLEVIPADRLQPDLDLALERCEEHLRDGGATEAETEAETETETKGWAVGGGPAILRGLSAADRRALRPYLTRARALPGEVVFAQGDPPDSIYFLAAGRVEVTIALPDTDRRMRIQTLADGAVFGEMAVIDPQPRSATVGAITPSVLYRLSAQDFARLKTERPDLAFRLLENVALIFAERLRASNVLVAQLEV